MKRWAVGLVMLCAIETASIADSQAAQPKQTRQRTPVTESTPRRYSRASMSQVYVYKNRAGQVKTREVYPGYREHFPPPAYLFYGYPHSGDYSGLGF